MAHNAKFDLAMLMQHLGATPKNVFCTRVGSRMLWLGLRMSHSLKACLKRYCGIEMDKAAWTSFIGVRRDELTDEQFEYGVLDTEYLFPLYDAQIELARERGQVELLQNFTKLSWITARWEWKGMLIDQERWLEIAAQVATKRDEIAAEVEKLLLPPGYAQAFRSANFANGLPDISEIEDDDAVDMRPDAIISLIQVALVKERLSEVLAMPVPSLGKDERAILEAAYAERHGRIHPFFEMYSKWAKLAKLASTYGVKFLWAVHPLTGRIHATFNIAGTDTAQYSSYGPNLLNIPTPKGRDDVDFRGAFLAEPGHLYRDADFSAMEQRIAADLTKDPNLIALFISGGDSHSVTAALMFHYPALAGETRRAAIRPRCRATQRG